MRQPRSESLSTDRNSDHGVWECRYFFSVRPPELSFAELSTVLGSSSDELIDLDHYLLGRNESANLKLRERDNCVKLKTLAEDSDSEFELWNTLHDSPLPVTEEIWWKVLAQIGVESDDSSIGQVQSTDEAVAALSNTSLTIRIVSVEKRRQFWFEDNVRVEAAEIRVGIHHRWSFAVESSDLHAARTVIRRFAEFTDSSRKNYPQFLRTYAW